ncbi:NAD(P)H-quinone oxidoreductase [Actinidia chinensis var. chinensis]|uniref:NAD(P)H-quinone oxidoreductase n=1 Tax=Actinidia chinensis var. chinensis TaxID=1590841 RepID=A0A2R6PZK3_ACTCC|nr:NAD(P)H-quinone oxidoreductase [Actinidia chinensis var. chinensis]
MGWLWRERRGPKWKQSWADRTLASMFETPIPLLVFFVVTVLLLYAPYYLDTKTRMQQAILNFQLFLFLLPAIFLLFIHLVSSIRDPTRPWHTLTHSWDGSTWGVAAVVVLVLVLVSYQSSLKSMWFRV